MHLQGGNREGSRGRESEGGDPSPGTAPDAHNLGLTGIDREITDDVAVDAGADLVQAIVRDTNAPQPILGADVREAGVHPILDRTSESASDDRGAGPGKRPGPISRSVLKGMASPFVRQGAAPPLLSLRRVC